MVAKLKMPEAEWWTVTELSGVAGVTRAWVYDLIDRGILRPARFPRRRSMLYRFHRDYAMEIVKHVQSGLPITTFQIGAK